VIYLITKQILFLNKIIKIHDTSILNFSILQRLTDSFIFTVGSDQEKDHRFPINFSCIKRLSGLNWSFWVFYILGIIYLRDWKDDAKELFNGIKIWIFIIIFSRKMREKWRKKRMRRLKRKRRQNRK